MYNSFAYPTAVAHLRGGDEAPDLVGKVKFYQKREGVLVVANIENLPESGGTGFFAFHIHEGNNCEGAGFSGTGNHYDPYGVIHPHHAGDLPPLMSCNGGAYMAVMTDRFRVRDIIGQTVVIHSDYDDFYSQPGGNAGVKIACGVIRRG